MTDEPNVVLAIADDFIQMTAEERKEFNILCDQLHIRRDEVGWLDQLRLLSKMQEDIYALQRTVRNLQERDKARRP